MPTGPARKQIDAREAITATLLAVAVFVVVLLAVPVLLLTGWYAVLFDGLNWFLDWEHASTATMLVALVALIAGARLWRWLACR